LTTKTKNGRQNFWPGKS